MSLRDVFSAIADYPFIAFFCALFVLGILDGIAEIVRAFRKK